MTPEKRIPELDAARGICILGMIIIHAVYDLTELYPILHWDYPPFFLLLKEWGGVAFFLISGICATLGHRHLRRGLIVLGCGVLVSAVTVLAGFAPIRFGVLHCLGLCMLCWELFRKAAGKLLCALGILFIVSGFLFRSIHVTAPYLYPLGLITKTFESADFFPLLPYLGFFLAGAVLGRRCYPDRKSLFRHLPPLRFFRFCGRHSLFLYLIHQPVLIFFIEAAVFTGGTFHETFH